MKLGESLTPAQRAEVDRILGALRKADAKDEKKGVTVTTDQFLAETEVSDEEYNSGMVVPAIR